MDLAQNWLSECGAQPNPLGRWVQSKRVQLYTLGLGSAHLSRAPPLRTRHHSNPSTILHRQNGLIKDDDHEQLIPTSKWKSWQLSIMGRHTRLIIETFDPAMWAIYKPSSTKRSNIQFVFPISKLVPLTLNELTWASENLQVNLTPIPLWIAQLTDVLLGIYFLTIYSLCFNL
jgi:hypothetical protein